MVKRKLGSSGTRFGKLGPTLRVLRYSSYLLSNSYIFLQRGFIDKQNNVVSEVNVSTKLKAHKFTME